MRENSDLVRKRWLHKRKKMVRDEACTGVVFVVVLLALIVGFFFTSAFLTTPQ